MNKPADNKNSSLSENSEQLVVFSLNQNLYALYLHSVIRVVQSVEIRELPKSPKIIAGIINIKGEIIPVIDLRKRFMLEEREIRLEDHFIITDTGKRQVALWIDSVSEIKNINSDQLFNIKESFPYSQYIKGVAKTEDNLILIYDLEQFLNLNEEYELEKALLNIKSE